MFFTMKDKIQSFHQFLSQQTEKRFSTNDEKKDIEYIISNNLQPDFLHTLSVQRDKKNKDIINLFVMMNDAILMLEDMRERGTTPNTFTLFANDYLNRTSENDKTIRENLFGTDAQVYYEKVTDKVYKKNNPITINPEI